MTEEGLTVDEIPGPGHGHGVRYPKNPHEISHMSSDEEIGPFFIVSQVRCKKCRKWLDMEELYYGECGAS